MISVIIPVYNAEKYLERCLDSVLNSRFRDLEIILVNDGSTDGSPALCSRYAEREPRIRLITQKNQGVSAARNRGIDEARGEWILFLDADDFITDDFLSMTAAEEYKEQDLLLFLFALHGTSAPSSSPKRTSEKKKIRKKEHPENGGSAPLTFRDGEMLSLISRILVPRPLPGNLSPDFRTPCARAYKRELLNRYSIRFSPEIKIGEDLLFNLEYQLKAKSCTLIPKTVYFYEVHPDSSSRHFNPNLRENHARLLQAVRDVLHGEDRFLLPEPDYGSYALENLTYVLIREIFSPLSPRSYRENCSLCREMQRSPLYREALKYNGRTGILPRRILVFFYRLKCFPAVRAICRISYFWLTR